MPSWLPAAIAILAAIGLFFFEIFLKPRREHTKSRREAIAKFRSAFAEAIAQIANKDAHVHMSQAQAQHDAAIIEFRRFVDPKQIEHFNAAEQKFHQCRSEVKPKVLKIRTAIDSGKPVDNSDIVKLKEAINELLTFADKT